MQPDIVDKKHDKQLIVKMAGYLEKKGRMRVVGVRRWKKRWCVLEGKLLLYFKTQLEYSHHLSPCRGSVNMGLALSITQRGPCQLQIVTRSQIIILRTKSKSDLDEWFAALKDAKNNNLAFIKDRNSTFMETSYQSSFRIPLIEPNSNNCSIINENHLRFGRSVRETFDGISFEAYNKQNDIRYIIARNNRKSSALRKSESDNRISFYRKLHGLVRTETIAGTSQVSDKESCRSRSLSYESIYFKPQEKCTPIEPAKSQSCRELMPKIVRQMSKKCTNNCVSKRISRSVSFFGKHREDSDSDDYDYIEIEPNHIDQNPSEPMVKDDKSEHHPELPPHYSVEKDEETTLMSAKNEEFHNQEANIDVIYVNNDRKIFTTESDLILEYGTEQSVEEEDEPPPLPIKKKHKQNDLFDEKPQYQIIDGVYVFKNGSKEVIYDVPIPHGKLIEHFRRLTITSMSSPVKRYADNTAYQDSLEPSIYETLHMTPDSLEVSMMFPTYKRWSNDSGFNNYEEQNSFLPDQTNFEDSLEPVINMIHHDRKIWQNVPNINSTDYFR
ncbi:PH domain-containing protein [Aphis craccivora]|uniref:PH domain-containing protein n=1 Tax=Aphis craccivora TaxID=307492 RepID=A0A6G0YUQ8_APHCR|nr:PH domain-containing protein [Aphis craccivora]